MSAPRMVAPEHASDDAGEQSFRPLALDEFVGQRQVRDNLRVFVAGGAERAARRSTTCSSVRAARPRQDDAGPDRRARDGRRLPRDLGAGDPARRRSRRAPHQSQPRDVLFIDEIHRLTPAGRGDPLSGDGGFPARPHHRRGSGGALGADRPAAFHPGRRHDALRPHHPAAARALRHSAAPRLLRAGGARAHRQRAARACSSMELDAGRRRRDRAALARHAPRRRRGCLRRVRDFAAVAGVTRIDRRAADAALKRLEVDGAASTPWTGATSLHRRELRRRPGRRRDAGRGARPSSATSIEEVIEPYLIQQGFVQRTPRGRMLTDRAYRLSRRRVAPRPRPPQLDLLRRGRGGGAMIRSTPRDGRIEADAYLYPVRVYYEDTDAAGHRLLRQLPQIRRARAHRDAAAPRHRAGAAARATTGLAFVVRRCTRRLSAAGAARRRARRRDPVSSGSAAPRSSSSRTCSAATTHSSASSVAHRLPRPQRSADAAAVRSCATAILSLNPATDRMVTAHAR